MNRNPLIGILAITVSFIAWGPSSYSYSADNVGHNLSKKPEPRSKSARTLQNSLGPSLVSINGRQMIVRKRNPDGTLAPAAPYIIRGVDWSAAGASTTNAYESRRLAFEDWASIDIPLIKNMNVNTVFMYLDPHLTANGIIVLDQLYNNGIMVVMTVDEGTNNTNQAQQAVSFFKGHPAILAWNLGVEWNINYYYTMPPITVMEAAMRTQTAAALIKALDSNHPVMTSYGDIDINDTGRRLSDTQHYVKDVCTSVDFWGLNIFRNSNFGTLFDQWKAISTKPMLLGEFGTDAFRTYNPNTPAGSVDENMQAQWDLAEWNDIVKNLSANHPGKAALGGFIFEWNDEWWKVPPDGQQDPNGGNASVCGGHPDSFCNEEYFGIVALDGTTMVRHPRAVYNTMTAAFAANYQPPANQAQIFRAASAGALVPNALCGFGRIYKGNARLFDMPGCSVNAGRGFNVAVFDPCTGELMQPIQNFDTWFTRPNGSALTALTNFLNGLPNGVLVMLAVGDEAGLTQDNSCTHFTFSWIEPFYQTLEALGSTQIRNYCFRDSWAMVAIKGDVGSKREDLKTNLEASAQITLSISSSISPTSRSFAASAGSGAISVTVPNGCNWTALTADSFITISSGSSGTGSGVVGYSVDAHAGLVRTGTILIAGRLFTITQAQAGASGGRTPFEFDGDTKTELAVWRPAEGNWYVINSSTGAGQLRQWGVSTDKIVPGDYDGDAKTDFAIWRPSEGNWYIINSSTGAGTVRQWGVPSDIPVPGDYDGDGKTDFAVWRPSEGNWYIINSSTGVATIRTWGVNTDKPVPGDYDGDGRTDFAVWRPSEGNWYVAFNRPSGGGILRTWGVSTDMLVPADYDGDGKTDFAVWRPSEGNWYVAFNSPTGGGMLRQWGFSTDVPVPGDYDGDGKTDFAVWRPSEGNWYIINSSTGAGQLRQWGVFSDVPVPSAFIR